MSAPHQSTRSSKGSSAESRNGLRLRSREYALLSGCVLIIYLPHVLLYNGLIDDAFISFRYARNLAEGLGLVFNPGERVEGYTNPLWVLILSALVRVGADPLVWSRIIGVIAGAGTLLLVHRAARRLRPDPPMLALVAPVLLACNRTVCVWSTQGLETSFFSFLCMAGLYLAGGTAPHWSVMAGTALGLAALTRPEGILVFAGLALVMALDRLRRIPGDAATDRLAGFQQPLLVSLPFFVLVVSHLVFRLVYYGRWLPNTYAVKVTGLYPASGLVHVALFARDNLLGLELPLILIAAWALWRAKDRRGPLRTPLACLVAAVGYLVYIFSIGGDHFEYRFFHPVLVMLALPVSMGVFETGAFLARSGSTRLARIVTVTCVLVMAARGIIVSGAGFQVVVRTIDLGFQKGDVSITSIEYEHGFARTLVHVGQWLGRHADPDETVGVEAAGAVPYFSRLRAVDVLGLTEPDGASFPAAPQRFVGHERRAGTDYLMRRGVTYFLGKMSMRFSGPDPLRAVVVSLPEGGDYSFQSATPEARIQPGHYDWP